jgi:hypothetical protein
MTPGSVEDTESLHRRYEDYGRYPDLTIKVQAIYFSIFVLMHRHKHIWIGAILALVLYAVPIHAQTSESPPEPTEEAEAAKENSEVAEAIVQDSKSGYSDTVNSAGGGGPGSSDEPDSSTTFQYFYRIGIGLGNGWQILSDPVRPGHQVRLESR